MIWPFGSSDNDKDSNEDEAKKKPISWSASLGSRDSDYPFTAAKEWAPVVVMSLAGLGALQLYANYLRRIPGAAFVRPDFFRRRSLFGKVTSVGDGDGFRLFHTPGGRAVGWGWLRKVPETRKELQDRTVGGIMTRQLGMQANSSSTLGIDPYRRRRRSRGLSLRSASTTFRSRSDEMALGLHPPS